MQPRPLGGAEIEAPVWNVAVEKFFVVGRGPPAVVGRLQVGAHHGGTRQTVARGAGSSRDFQLTFIDQALERTPDRRRADSGCDVAPYRFPACAGMGGDIIKKGLVGECYETIFLIPRNEYLIMIYVFFLVARYRFTIFETIYRLI